MSTDNLQLQVATAPLPESLESHWLLMLDVDGTLLDIAHRPDAVTVPLELKETLMRLYHILRGALVLVSGRPIADLDVLFAPLRLPCVGLHGGEMRITGTSVSRQQPSALQEHVRTLSAQCKDFAAELPGVLVEPKPTSVAIHYRLNPAMASAVQAKATELVRFLGNDWMVLNGKQVCEIKPRHFDKGKAVHHLCGLPQFAGRTPVYLGDDVTDESALAAARELGGIGIKIGESPAPDVPSIESPALLRRWLSQISHQTNNLDVQPLRSSKKKRHAQLADSQRIIVISNRVTLPRAGKGNTGGLAVAMSALLQEHGGVWLGWSGKTSDTPGTQVLPKGQVTYILQDITQQDYESFYMQFCNAILWPLLHYNIGLTDFAWSSYQDYRRVNEEYAKLVKSILKPDDYIWIHDFHFIPLAHELRKLGVKNRIGFFLHTPFPSREVLQTLPVHKELMGCFAAYNVVGLQTKRDLEAFRDYATSENIHLHVSEGSTDPETIIDSFPISIDTHQFAQVSRTAIKHKEAQDLIASLGGRKLIFGVDRMDYSKGIIHRMKSIDELLSSKPELAKQFTFLQVAPPTREEIIQYAQLRSEVESLVGHINGKHGMVDWVPIRFMARGLKREVIAAFYRVARICLVTPLRDGMNLVAKEYIAAQDPNDPGVLILSRFAGAAEEFQQALLVNPYDIHELANALEQALTMPKIERQERWRAMYDTLSRQTLDKWYQDYLDALAGL